MQKRDFETYQKRFRDFEILPKFSETHVFRGTIRHPSWLQAYARAEIKSLGEICFHFVSCADHFIRIPDLLPFFSRYRKISF